MKLLKLGKLGDIEVNVETHRIINSSRAVITDRELGHVTEEELLENLKEQDVCGIRRIMRRAERRLTQTNSFILTFSTSNLPKSIKIAYVRCNDLMRE